MTEELARRMALSINGGDWEADYTDAQKRGWLLKAEFCTTEANAQTALALERAKREGLEMAAEIAEGYSGQDFDDGDVIARAIRAEMEKPND